MICVDASVAAKWLFPEEHSDKALALVAAAARAGERIAGPALLPIEVANIIRQRMVREGVSLADARRLLVQFLAFQVTTLSPADLIGDALSLADAQGLPAVYDACYVGLAVRLGCDLWTADQRLLARLGGRLPFVKWIGDFPGTAPT